MTRSCANCEAPDSWPRFRYCDDCWRMVGKTLGAVLTGAGTALGGYLITRVFALWF